MGIPTSCHKGSPETALALEVAWQIHLCKETHIVERKLVLALTRLTFDQHEVQTYLHYGDLQYLQSKVVNIHETIYLVAIKHTLNCSVLIDT